MQRSSILFLSIFFGGFFANNLQADQNIDTKQTLFSVSISPIAFLLEQLIPTSAKVFVLVQAGQNPETFQAQPSQLEQLASSNIYFSLGLPIEQKIISTLLNGKKKPEIVELEVPHSTQLPTKHTHDHKGLHPWTSPLKMRLYARSICQALLKQKSSTNTANLTQRCLKIDKELELLHKDLKDQLAEYKNQKFLVFHPAWSEFAELYQLEQIAVEDEGKEPSAKHLQDITMLVQQGNLRNFYFQPQHSLRTAETLAKQLKLDLVELDPLKFNYLENMRYVSRVLSADFKRQRTNKQSKPTFNKLN